MKKIQFKTIFLLLAIISAPMVSCGDKEEGATEPTTPEVVDSLSEPKDTLVIPPDTLFAESDAIQMEFHLFNGRCDTSSTFVEGETILFLLNITNKTDSTLRLFRDFWFNGQDMFRITSLDGKDYGTFWEYRQPFPSRTPFFSSQEKQYIFASWYNSIRGSVPPACNRKDSAVIPPGNYRAVASLLMPDSTTALTCAVYFEVVPFDSIERTDCYQVAVGRIGDYGQVWAMILDAPEISQPTTTSNDVYELRKYEAPSVGQAIRFPSSDLPNQEVSVDDTLCVYISGYTLSYESDHGMIMSTPHYDCNVILYQ